MRHGQTDWNKTHKAMGITDIPLNAHGVKQAENARKKLADLPIKTICHSPLKRAKHTAEILHKDLNCEMISFEELKEFNVGSFAGQAIGGWFDEWRKGKTLPEGETYLEFITRSLHGIQKALELPGPVLIVSHGGTYWAVQHAVQLFSPADISNCEPVFFEAPSNSTEKWSCTNLSKASK